MIALAEKPTHTPASIPEQVQESSVTRKAVPRSIVANMTKTLIALTALLGHAKETTDMVLVPSQDAFSASNEFHAFGTSQEQYVDVREKVASMLTRKHGVGHEEEIDQLLRFDTDLLLFIEVGLTDFQRDYLLYMMHTGYEGEEQREKAKEILKVQRSSQ